MKAAVNLLNSLLESLSADLNGVADDMVNSINMALEAVLLNIIVMVSSPRLVVVCHGGGSVHSSSTQC